MANTKISELTALGATPADDDVLAIVDTSDSTTKKVTVSNLVSAASGFDPNVDNPAIGNGSSTGTNAVAYGHDATANASEAIAIGFTANAADPQSIAIGSQSSIGSDTATGSVAIGQQASVANFSTFGVAIGRQATASSYYTTAVGTGSTASGANNASAFGYNATASGADSAAVGYSATASGSGSVAVGRSAGASGFGGTSIGQNSDATGSQSAAYGYNAQATGGQSLALGLNSVANQPNTIAIGYGPDATADQAIAIGNDAQARGVNTVVIGHDAQGASGANSVVSIGLSANVQGFAGVAVGANSSAGAANTLHINASGAVTNAPATAGHMVIETDDAKLEYDGDWTLNGGKLLSGQIEKQYKYEGSLAVNTGTARLYIPVACSATDINLYLKTASSSGSVGVDFLINGTVDTSMTIAQGSTSGSGSSTTAISAGSYITFDITSAGTGAEDLYAAISLTRS